MCFIGRYRYILRPSFASYRHEPMHRAFRLTVYPVCAFHRAVSVMLRPPLTSHRHRPMHRAFGLTVYPACAFYRAVSVILRPPLTSHRHEPMHRAFKLTVYPVCAFHRAVSVYTPPIFRVLSAWQDALHHRKSEPAPGISRCNPLYKTNRKACPRQ